jgi:predicted unusual protein kinase regulating ubiquinone biosynthesis (AarF/ABC1/UbiB family)
MRSQTASREVLQRPAPARGLRRMWQLGGLVVETGRATLARTPAVRSRAREHVADRLGALRGIPQKLGQLLWELPEAPPRGRAAWHDLTETDAAVRSEVTFAWIAEELGRPVNEVFRTLERTARAASLGQVHRGRLRDGRDVAVKIQYPGMADALADDLRVIGWLGRLRSGPASEFDIAGYRREIGRTLGRELDYVREAATLERFVARARRWPLMVVPVPVREVSTGRLLVMSWLDGEPLEAACKWPARDRKAAAEALLGVVLRGALTWRELHADLHPGNLRFRRTAFGVQIGLLDFGCVRTLSRSASTALATLLRHGPSMSKGELVDLYSRLGFHRDRLAPVSDRLPWVTKALARPFVSQEPMALRDWCPGADLAGVLAEDRWALRQAGVPSLAFFIRAVASVLRCLQALDVPINFRSSLDEVSPADQVVAPVTAPCGDQPAPSQWPDRHLKVTVLRDGELRVALTLPAAAVANLPDLVPVDARMSCGLHRGDLAALARQALMDGLPRRDLFACEHAGASVRVWLE